MPKLTIENARDGGRAKAAARTKVIPPTTALKSPFDVLKPGFKKDEVPVASRTATAQGTERVEFPPNWHKKNGRKEGEETSAPAEKGAPWFKPGDHPLDVDVLTRLNFLPKHRHVFEKAKR